MKISGLLALLLLALSCGLAQSPTRIDGRQHPELIPDNTAYRAVFLMHSHSASAEETARSEQLHALIGLNGADHIVYDTMLKDFRARYDEIVQTHDAFVVSNTASAAIADLQAEVAATRRSISALVQVERGRLQSEMSSEGLSKLAAFVQGEKTHMIVGVRSAQ